MTARAPTTVVKFLAPLLEINLLTIELVLRKWLSILLPFAFIFLFDCTGSVGDSAYRNFTCLYKVQSCTNPILGLKGLSGYRERRKGLKNKDARQKESNKHSGWRRWQKKDTSWFRYPWSPRDRLKHRSPYCWCQQFELKLALILMVQQSQFGGMPLEGPNLTHAACDILKLNGVSPNAIHLRLFPFSLRDKARAWLHSLPSRWITTWDELTRAFLAKFFPMSKTASLRNKITNFKQKD